MDELSQIRNSFPLSEPSYIVLLIIAIFSFLMLTLIAVIAYMSKNTPKFRLLIMFNLLIINFMNSFSVSEQQIKEPAVFCKDFFLLKN